LILAVGTRESPHRLGLPLSRFPAADIREEILAHGLAAQVSGTAIWRWLSRGALCPWRHHTWIQFSVPPREMRRTLWLGFQAH
jgi:hypothetical protein